MPTWSIYYRLRTIVASHRHITWRGAIVPLSIRTFPPHTLTHVPRTTRACHCFGLGGLFLTCALVPRRAVYYVADEARQSGYLPRQPGDESHIAVRVVSAGIKILTPHRRHGTWLLTQAGARVLEAVARRQRVELPADDLQTLLRAPPGKARTARGLRHASPLSYLSPTGRAAVDAAGLSQGAVLVTVKSPVASGRIAVLPARLVWKEARDGGTIVGPSSGSQGGGSGRQLSLALTLFHPRGLEHLPSAWAAATIASVLPRAR